jgi:hypothetical protein
MVDTLEFIESLPSIIPACVVPELLLLLHQLGRHVIRGCSEPLDDCLGFPPQGLGISKKGKSEVDPIFAVDLVAMQVVGSVVHLAPFRLIDSLSRPSENITGMSLMVPEMAVKRLELLRELIPGISRVLVPSFLAAAPRPRFHEVGVVRESVASRGQSPWSSDFQLP